MRKIILNDCLGRYGWSNRGIVEVLRKKRVMDNAKFFEGNRSGLHAEITVAEFICRDGSDEFDSYVEVDGRPLWEIDREDMDAIAVLEKCGSEFCSGQRASLSVEEYDDEDFVIYIDGHGGTERLGLIPNLTEARIRACQNIDEVVELMRRTGALLRI